jgi:4-oxalocrotonate tautomerase
MPHVTIKMYPGRSEQVKSRLTDQIVKDVTAIANCKEDAVSVSIEEVQPADWAEKVYKPEIQSNWEKLYKKPGYTPA